MAQGLGLLDTGGSNVPKTSWFHRNIGFLKAIAKNLPFGETIAQALDIIDQVLGTGKISTIALDKPSADILDKWDATKFVPFYTQLLQILSKKVSDVKIDKVVRAQFANEILLKIAATKEYYINNGNEGLSNEGILNRLEYLDKMLTIISNHIIYPSELDINASIAELNLKFEQIDIHQNFKSIDLGLLQLPNLTDFDITATVFKVSSDINQFTPSPATAASNPPPTVNEIKDAIKNAGGSTEGIDNITPEASTITTSKIIKALGFLLIAIGLLSTSKKESSIKNQ